MFCLLFEGIPRCQALIGAPNAGGSARVVSVAHLIIVSDTSILPRSGLPLNTPKINKALLKCQIQHDVVTRKENYVFFEVDAVLFWLLEFARRLTGTGGTACSFAEFRVQSLKPTGLKTTSPEMPE